jgi:hypothetical protein
MKRLLQTIERYQMPSVLKRASGRDESIYLDLVPILFVIVACAIMFAALAIRFVGSLFN